MENRLTLNRKEKIYLEKENQIWGYNHWIWLWECKDCLAEEAIENNILILNILYLLFKLNKYFN